MVIKKIKINKNFIAIEDKVWARNEQSGLMNYQSVLRTINSTDPDTAYLVVADQNGKQQTIVSDSKHPYFAQYGTDPTPPQPSPGKPYHGNIVNAYWVNAANLEAGHKLIDDSGNWQTVVSVRVEPKPLNSYNLEVENDHTFFIRGLGGDAGIWVHNTDCWLSLPPGAKKYMVGNQEVNIFKDQWGNTIRTIQNPIWHPGMKAARFIEVKEVNGKIIIANVDKPNIYRTPGKPAKGEGGLYTEDPRKVQTATNNGWMEQRRTNRTESGLLQETVKYHNNNQYFTREGTWQAPQKGSGMEYQVLQQDIDPNLRPFAKSGDMTTNLEFMKQGRNPYTIKNGNVEQIQLHHIMQDGRKIAELSESTHLGLTIETGRKAVHPYSPGQHPEYPVARDIFNRKDNPQYWKDRAKEFEIDNSTGTKK